MEVWHSLTINQVFNRLKTSKGGLSFEETLMRLKKYGLNKLPERKGFGVFKIFLSQFKNPLILILIFAAIICFALKEFIDLSVILGAIFLNTLIGFWQEFKAEKSLLALKKMIKYKAKVIRQERERIVDQEELVPGDILILEAGDIVLADSRVLESNNLAVNEAVLTGESMSSSKKIVPLIEGTVLADRENMVYSGTQVTRGAGKAIVVETGTKTEFGKIALMLAEQKEERTPLQKKIGTLASLIGLIIIILASGLFLLGLILGRPFFEMLLVSVAVAVAGVPEGLVIALTVSLAIGMRRILKKNALVRNLIAAETLGSVTVICSDKTGTLTEGKMTLSHIITFDKKEAKSKELAFRIGLLCNSLIIENPEDEIHQWKILGDQTEQALVLAAVSSGIDYLKTKKEYPKLAEIPFSSEEMLMATLHEIRNSKFDPVIRRVALSNDRGEIRNVIFVKGAPEKILERSSFLEEDGNQEVLFSNKKNQIKSEYLDLTSRGLRVLAVAYKPFNSQLTTHNLQLTTFNFSEIKDLVFVGLMALKDPLRQEAKITIDQCKSAGIRPVIVTGDHKLTAKIIAEEVGIETKKEILEGSDIDKLNDEELKKKVKEVNVFARVEPRHKIRIIDAFQSQKEVVAMTGDGVNDAPALKSADIGIALGSGTEVTKEAADIVLLDDNFKTIVEAVYEGRGIFDNIRKLVLYLLSSSFSEVILVAGSLIFGLPLPILPAQILWINIIQDGPPAMALTYEKTSPEAMKEKPRDLKVPILDKSMKYIVFIIGIMTDLVLFGLFVYLWKKGFNLFYIRTMIFVGLGVSALFYIFACKNLQKSIFHYNPFDNLYLNLSIIFGWLMFFVALYSPVFQKLLRTVPLNLNDWLILIGLGLFNLVAIEIGKAVFIKSK